MPDELKAPPDWSQRCAATNNAAGHGGRRGAAVPSSGGGGDSRGDSRGDRRGSGAAVTLREEGGKGEKNIVTTMGGATKQVAQLLAPPSWSMDTQPFVHSGGQFEYDDVTYVVPYLPSDVGDSILEDSDEVLVVTLTNHDGTPGWCYGNNGAAGAARVVLRHKMMEPPHSSALMWTSLGDVRRLVLKRVDVLARGAWRLDKCLYKACSPLKQSKLVVTLVLAEALQWHEFPELSAPHTPPLQRPSSPPQSGGGSTVDDGGGASLLLLAENDGEDDQITPGRRCPGGGLGDAALLPT